MLPENDEPYELTDEERSIRALYVTEWMLDNDWLDAAIRLGYTGEAAKTISSTFRDDPYVLNLIAKGEQEKPDCTHEEHLERIKRKIRSSLLREANYKGAGCSHSARVQALKTLLDLEGLNAPQKIEADITSEGERMADLSKLTTKELDAYHIILSKLNKPS